MIVIDRVYCGICHGLVKYKDHVYLDTLNTVIHQRCYNARFDMKDKGTFKEIVNKYSFFDEFRYDRFIEK